MGRSAASDNNSPDAGRSSSSSSGGGLLPYPRRRPLHPARGGGSGGGGGSSLSSSSSQLQLRNFSRSRHASEQGHLGDTASSYRPKRPFRSHPPSVRMPSSSLSESGPRPSFWERSHIALDRFRFRGRPYRGGSRWSRGRGGVSEEASRGADLWEEERDPDSAAVRAGESPLHLGRVVSLTWRSALGVSLSSL